MLWLFSTENELVDFFIKHSEKQDKFYIKELPTNFGRPDIIELVVNIELFKQRRKELEFLETPIQRMDTYIISYLKGKSWVKKETIKRYLNVNSSIINNSVSRLIDRNMLMVSSDEGSVKLKSKSELLFIKSLTAFEAKLSNWKYVIEQAERHLWFSKQSYILIPELSISIQEKAKELADKSGVGLALTDHKKIVYKTKKKNGTLINTPLLWELNEGIIDGRFSLNGRNVTERVNK